MAARGTWIAVVGPIGVGKSTLASIVATRTGSDFVPERFSENPFLERFYAPQGIARWGFQTEVAFLTQRVEQVVEIEQRLVAGRSVVTDFAPQQNLVFARITVAADEFQLYEQLYQQLFHTLPRPTRLVCLDADIRTIMSRVRKRARGLESSLDPKYLRKLREGYHQWRTHPPVPAVWIDTSKLPIPTDLVARAEALEAVTRSLEPAMQATLFNRPAAVPDLRIEYAAR